MNNAKFLRTAFFYRAALVAASAGLIEFFLLFRLKPYIVLKLYRTFYYVRLAIIYRFKLVYFE